MPSVQNEEDKQSVDEQTQFLDPNRVLSVIQIEERMKIADFGAGSGYMTFTAARLVGQQGLVYALDINKSVIAHLKGEIEHKVLVEQSAVNIPQAKKLLTLLRLAIVLCRRRTNEPLPDCVVNVTEKAIQLTVPNTWLSQHPLIADELQQEAHHLSNIDITLTINC